VEITGTHTAIWTSWVVMAQWVGGCAPPFLHTRSCTQWFPFLWVPKTSPWLASNWQQMQTWSKASSGYRHFTGISGTLG